MTRLQPGALGCDMGAFEDSFATGVLEYPQYTKPPAFRGQRVPDILSSGDHAKVARWRREQALLRTWLRRPDLLELRAACPIRTAKFLAQAGSRTRMARRHERH